MLKNFFNQIINFIIPPLCVSCENPIDNHKDYLCSKCKSKLILFRHRHPWRETYIFKGIINNSFSLYQFVKDSPIQHLLHSLKYEKMKSIGTMLGREIGNKLPGGVEFHFAVPVPLHIAKKRERTYNQSEYICRGLSEITEAVVLPKLLKRNKFTKSQTKLDKQQRIENVKGVFEINPKQKNLITGKNIVLLDDVITTGSTILECAKVLKENGAAYVLICSAAYDALD